VAAALHLGHLSTRNSPSPAKVKSLTCYAERSYQKACVFMIISIYLTDMAKVKALSFKKTN
jgi:hypothetical protein